MQKLPRSGAAVRRSLTLIFGDGVKLRPPGSSEKRKGTGIPHGEGLLQPSRGGGTPSSHGRGCWLEGRMKEWDVRKLGCRGRQGVGFAVEWNVKSCRNGDFCFRERLCLRKPRMISSCVFTFLFCGQLMMSAFMFQTVTSQTLQSPQYFHRCANKCIFIYNFMASVLVLLSPLNSPSAPAFKSPHPI